MIAYLKKHWIKSLVILFAFIFFLGRYEFKMPSRHYADFHVNYYTGQRMLMHQDIYDDNAYRADGIANFKYPPLFAVWSMLFALTSERIAATWWFIFNFCLIILALWLSGKLIFLESLTSRQKNWIYFLALLLTSRFWMRNFDEGQVNIVMMTAMIAGIFCAVQGKNIFAGFWGGLSVFVKYMGALLMPYFLIKRKWKALLSIGVSLVALTFLPAVFLGWERNLSLQQQYIPYVFKTSTDPGSLFDAPNQSVIAMLRRFFSAASPFELTNIHLTDTVLNIVVVICLSLLFVLCFFPKGKVFRYQDRAEIGMLLICVALFNPNAWLHAFIFLTFGYMVVLIYLCNTRFSDMIVLVLTIVSFVLHSSVQPFLRGQKAGDMVEILSLATFGALALYGALLKIRLNPKPERVFVSP